MTTSYTTSESHVESTLLGASTALAPATAGPIAEATSLSYADGDAPANVAIGPSILVLDLSGLSIRELDALIYSAEQLAAMERTGNVMEAARG